MVGRRYVGVVVYICGACRCAGDWAGNAEAGLRALHNIVCCARNRKGLPPPPDRLGALERAMRAAEGGAHEALELVASEHGTSRAVMARHKDTMEAIMAGILVGQLHPEVMREAERRDAERRAADSGASTEQGD